jgi:dienelactone hydrolase
MRPGPIRISLFLIALILPFMAPAADAMLNFPDPWPAADTVAAIRGERVTFASHSPFVPADVGTEDDRPTDAVGTLFLPPDSAPGTRHPAVIMLHGSAGVIEAREMTYGRQFAAMGIAALVIDAFGARRDMATAFVDRLLRITETMVLADAYAGLRFLAARPDIDPDRVVLIGFSYGGMSAVFAAYDQVAKLLAPEGQRFAGHVAFYGPCIARFENRRTIGAPVLMLFGGQDAIMNRDRCAEIVSDLREGGSQAEMVVYEEAHHQWDGGWAGPRRIGWDISPCRLWVREDGSVRDGRTWLPMNGSFNRRIILGLCADGDGYLVGRDDSVRAKSNRDLGRFLAEIFNGGTTAQ